MTTDLHNIDMETGEIITEDVPKAPPFLRTANNYDMDVASDATGLYCPEPTRAQQQFREDVDINTLVERFNITGQMPQLDRIPINADFVPVTDFHQALQTLQAAEDEFMKLPADVRKRFDNDAGKFLDFTSDDKNKDEIDKMGLLKPKDRDIVADLSAGLAAAIKTGSTKGDPVT